MPAAPETSDPARIIDGWDPLFVLVLQLQQTADPGPGDALRARLNEMLTKAAARTRELGANEETVNAARYAVVALLDEVVLTSSWPLKDAWLGRPLQMEHFNSFAAGEQFFSLLETIKGGNNPHRLELLEVFLTCICLGFRGKHVGVQGLELLRGIQRSLLAELGPGNAQAAAGRARRRGDPGDLSPAWKPPHEGLSGALPKELPVRLVAVLCLAGVLFAYAVLYAALSHGSSALTGGS